MKRLIIILTLISIGYGCKNVNNMNDSCIVTFNLTELPKITNPRLTDLDFVDIEYIPLETSEQSVISFTDNVLIGSIPPIKIVVGEGFYLIKQFNTILKFREDGSFVTKIGAVGRGPNEFTVAHDIDINIEDRNIYLVSAWQKKFNVYSETGEFKRSFNMPLYAPIDFRFVDNKILCYCENHMGNIEDSYTLLDTNGLVIKSFPNNYPFKNHDSFVFRYENLFYKFNNQLFKKEVYSDTVYVYEKMNFKPHIVIEVGNKLITPDARSMYDGMDIVKDYIQPLNLFEFGDYVYYEFIYKYEYPDILVFSFIGSKKSDYQTLFSRNDGIINDLDGGPNILPRTIKDDNTIIALADALQLKAYIASEEFKNSTPKYPEKKKELKKLAASLKETDNPVLVLVRLKE